jgi:hypothetical protein
VPPRDSCQSGCTFNAIPILIGNYPEALTDEIALDSAAASVDER